MKITMTYTVAERTVTKTFEWTEEDMLLDAHSLRSWVAEQVTAFLGAGVVRDQPKEGV